MTVPDSPYTVRGTPHASPFLQGSSPLLPTLDIELTERCCNDCIHCAINRPAADHEAAAREMTTEEVKRLLGEAAALGCLQVRFTGGEPLLRPDFEELYVHARRLGMKVLLFTNACLITPQRADLFVRMPPFTRIEVTVYGMTEGSYEAVTRTPGSFTRFRRGVDLLLARRIPFLVKGALFPANREEMAAFEAWAATIPWMDQPPVYSLFFDMRNRRDDPDKNRRIASLRPSPEEGVAVIARNRERYLKEMREFCGKFMGPPGSRLFECGFAEGGCVDAYGRFQPCMGIRAPNLTYDLQTGTLRDALEHFFPPLRDVRATNPDYLRRCAVCFLRGLCEQCPAKSWTEHGTLDTPVEYLCAVAHAQAQDLGLLADGEHGWDVEGWQERVKRFCEGAQHERGIMPGQGMEPQAGRGSFSGCSDQGVVSSRDGCAPEDGTVENKYFRITETVHALLPWGRQFATKVYFKFGFIGAEDRLVAKYMNRPSDVLIIGSGSGREARPICHDGHRIYCVDISSLYLQQGRRLFAAEGCGDIRFIAADMYHLPFSKESFDFVFFSLYSAAGEKRLDILRDIHAILRPGGLVLISARTHRATPCDGYVFFDSVSELEQDVSSSRFRWVEGLIDTEHPAYLVAVLRA